MRRSGFVLIGVLILCVLLLWAQGPAPSLEGVVHDASGGVLPGATVEVLNSAGTVVATTTADATGRYRFTGIPAGRYRIRAYAPGFQSLVVAVVIEQGKTAQQSLQLTVGSAAETIDALKKETHIVGGVAGGVPGGTMGGVIGGIIGGISSNAPPPPPYPSRPASQRMRTMPEARENYGHFEENRFQSPVVNPLSTFSIDVDTASYANMRRFLRNGSMPPQDAVRTEEWLNYFQYQYPEPAEEHPVSITTELATCPWQPKHKIVRIGLKSKSIEVGNLPPANLVFLIDVSGSMGTPDKLPLLKRSFSLLAEQLRPQDDVAIVVYAGAAGLVLPPTSGRHQDRILESIERLSAGGSTAGAQGIQLAYQTARAHFKSKGNNRVILATDGDFNVGVSTEAELIRLIEDERKGGIYLTVLGFGTGNYQDAKMKALSKYGNGNYAYVDNLLEARKVLVQEMGANLMTVAKDVKLQIEFNPARVQAYRLIGYENRLLAAEDFNDDKKDAGEMGAGHTVTALYEIVPPGVEGTVPKVDDLKYQKPQQSPSGKSTELLTVKLRYKPPTRDTSKLLSKPVGDAAGSIENSSEDLRFAAAVAGFALLLRDSEHKGSVGFDQVIDLASKSLGTDPNGHRAEFLYLVKSARGIGKSE
ncbi:MAG: von Willebrand factor type A domain-containing protein [Bryobacterales bacterium]|nr:von Willebrand factor type A domain-containing protein [Bryobacterales bacterium]